jgi:hypothetical protein
VEYDFHNLARNLMEIEVRSYGTRGEGEFFRKRRWNTGEGNDSRARCVNGVLGFCVKVFPATNRSNHQRVDAGTKHSATDTKEEGRNVKETDGEDAE